MRTLAIALFAFSCFTAAAGQAAPCTMTLDELPEIRGLKLGMSSSRYYELVPEATVQGYPARRAHAKYIRSRHLRGIREIKSSFFEDKLISFTVIYGLQVKSDSVGAFRRKLTRDLGLPQNSKWRFLSHRASSLECKDFTIDASVYPRKVYLEDTGAIARRRELGPTFN